MSRSPRSKFCFGHTTFKFATMTCLTVTEHLCHKLPRISSVCRYHNPVLSSFMTYHRLCSKSYTMGAACGTGTAYPSGTHSFLCRVLLIIVCPFVIFLLAIVLWVEFFFELRILMIPLVSSIFSVIVTLKIQCMFFLLMVSPI